MHNKDYCLRCLWKRIVQSGFNKLWNFIQGFYNGEMAAQRPNHKTF